jgi:hypothetical protein
MNVVCKNLDVDSHLVHLRSWLEAVARDLEHAATSYGHELLRSEASMSAKSIEEALRRHLEPALRAVQQQSGSL